MESKDLEFHYVISYRPHFGWQVAVDVEQSVMQDGTIYDYDNHEWVMAYEDSPDEEIAAMADLDTQHFRVLQSALRQMNGEPNA